MVFVALMWVCLGMAALWLLQLVTRNASWVDLGWTAALVFLAYFYAFHSGLNVRKNLFLTMVTLWGGRLFVHLVLRLTRDPREDSRYRAIRERWADHLQQKLFLFFQLQAVLAWVLSLPFFLILTHHEKQIGAFEIGGFTLWAAALTGEYFADKQLADFKINPENKGKVCRAGLWNYSRHPNYFFEWLVWISYFIFSLASPYGILAALAPALMLYFLLRVSGIPPAEEQALASRGEAYRHYQKTTSVFIPWFNKEGELK